MKRLLFMRHAKSDWSTGDADIDRPLNSRGKKDSVYMADILSGLEYPIDLIYCSPAVRTRLTIEPLLEASKKAGKKTKVDYVTELYMGSYELYNDLITNVPSSIDTLMIVGHNPIMEVFTAGVLGSADHNLEIPTAAVICFKMNLDGWKLFTPENSTLDWFIRPKTLRQMTRTPL